MTEMINVSLDKTNILLYSIQQYDGGSSKCGTIVMPPLIFIWSNTWKRPMNTISHLNRFQISSLRHFQMYSDKGEKFYSCYKTNPRLLSAKRKMSFISYQWLPDNYKGDILEER